MLNLLAKRPVIAVLLLIPIAIIILMASQYIALFVASVMIFDSRTPGGPLYVRIPFYFVCGFIGIVLMNKTMDQLEKLADNSRKNN